MVELQPLQRNDGRGGRDVAGLQLRYRLGKGHDGDADIFCLCCQAVQPSDSRSIDFAAKQGDALGRAARADKVVVHMHDVLDVSSRPLRRLHVGRRLPGFHQA